ncbi:MAG TPA: DUF2235 domain-containing protein [Dyella sp.]|uniref:DUF2235 domain-containing protein n=1 Tax=Dyella sp. TaxID=1869338 RepID=UPI002C8A6D52|nr:DUF2235 domain-containing protein [Dyella sp.]HTV85026.1 DUF2235 domain-containing protein [Dyella sp.]
MAKTIVFCADGTWNGPGQPDDTGQSSGTTNVLKLFLSLKGTDTPDTVMLGDEQEKTFTDDTGLRQVAKYLHGVGDSRNVLVRLMGGALGAGTITRIVRGYTYVSRNYAPGDQIVLVGFSRGAYTARALAAFIVSQGLLNPALGLDDKENAYRLGAAAWYAFRRQANTDVSWLGKFENLIADLPGFVTRPLPAGSFVAPVSIHAVAVWDTVGALGIPQYAVDGDRLDTFQFATNDLSGQVAYGIHAISVDEERRDFTPTLWNDRANIVQALFAGAHADVGGGYPSALNQSGLSDTSLQWMRTRLSDPPIGLLMNGPVDPFNADALGVSHQPWTQMPWNIPNPPGARTAMARDFSSVPHSSTLGLHVSVTHRWGQNIQCGPGAPITRYAPANIAPLFDGANKVFGNVRVYP